METDLCSRLHRHLPPESILVGPLFIVDRGLKRTMMIGAAFPVRSGAYGPRLWICRLEAGQQAPGRCRLVPYCTSNIPGGGARSETNLTRHPAGLQREVPACAKSNCWSLTQTLKSGAGWTAGCGRWASRSCQTAPRRAHRPEPDHPTAEPTDGLAACQASASVGVSGWRESRD